MFEKYGINDLYLASILVAHPDSQWDINAGGLLIGSAGYGYWTVLLKNEKGQYIDLNNRKITISETRSQIETSYTVDFIEPLSNYCVHDKKVFSRRQAIREAELHYNEIHRKMYELILQKDN